ncbi:exo-beta-N-acetylmuramidase NamZ domain-containing protein [Zunongwangia sp.]|uniref:exo-beta-N-acetylmuramidase NamZ family protein n=1 Tax=Zunongwangia sp. TaxID=1965325 RepID=UPI003AA89432
MLNYIIRFFKSTFLFSLIAILSCGNTNSKSEKKDKKINESQLAISKKEKEIEVGANQTEQYLPLLQHKRVGLLGNQSSLLKQKNGNYIHLVDSLLALQVDLKKVFAPEHGFRGNADAGEIIANGKDPKTGLPVISLYGSHKKPTPEQLKDIDILIFDLQDVGARFYTYISSLHYVMEACAENNIPLLVFDRPNPNEHYIDGPILEKKYKSFVGMHPVPIVHGMTIGEYAQMINGEGWLKNHIKCDLKIIKMNNYTHHKKYSLPVKPSPNLPNDKAINLYPSLCFFEGTTINAGRGTNKQFQVYGSPFLNPDLFPYSYTPKSMHGAKHPKHLGVKCYGEDLSTTAFLDKINLKWLIKAYKNTNNKSNFFTNFFIKLAGTKKLQEQIENGLTAEKIRKSWQPGLEKFKEKRQGYLLYP